MRSTLHKHKGNIDGLRAEVYEPEEFWGHDIELELEETEIKGLKKHLFWNFPVLN
jgi:hypothetical protein